MIGGSMINKILALVFVSCLMSACATTKQAQETLTISEYKLKLALADESYLKKDYTQALSLYSEINQKFAKDPHVLFRMGNIYASSAKPLKAIDAYEGALEVDKSLTKAWYNLGVVYMQQSGRTWANMSKYADQNDPLYPSAGHYSRGMLELIPPNKN